MYHTSQGICDASLNREITLITAAQLRAARALLGMDQRALAHAARLSVPTIQRMEASEGVIRGTVDSLMKLIAAIEAAGVELINEGDTSPVGGRGVRLREANVVAKQRAPARSDAQRSKSLVAQRARRPIDVSR
jgi:transcriptional regulator with XRE-family HTH domain